MPPTSLAGPSRIDTPRNSLEKILLLVFMLSTAAVSAAEVPKAAAEASPADPASPSEVVAIFDGGRITAEDIWSWQLFHRKAETRKPSPPAGSASAESMSDGVPERAMLEAMAVQMFLAESALREGLAGCPATRMALLWFEISQLEVELRRHLTERLRLPEGALEAAVEAKGQRFDRPRRVRLRNIFLRLPEDADAAARMQTREALETLRQRVLAGEDFGQLARAESDSQTRWRDGALGWIKPGSLDPAVEKVAMALGVGEMSPVLEQAQGFTLLYCEDVKEATRADPAEVRSKLRRRLRRTALVAQVEELRRTAVERAEIDIELLAGSSSDLASPKPGAAPVGKGSKAEVKDPEKGQAVLSGGGLQLDLEEARALLEHLGRAPQIGEGPASAEVSHGLEQALQEVVYRAAAARQARQEGLHLRPEVAARVRWGRSAILAAEAMLGRVEERFAGLEDAELRAYFDDNPERYRQPETFRFGVIRRFAPRAEVRQIYAEMEDLAAALHAGEISFEAAARAHSDLPSAVDGGTTAWWSRKQAAALGPTVSKALAELGPDEISDLVQQSEGLRGDSSLWIVRRLGRREARLRTFEEARPRVEKELATQKGRRLQAEISAEILGKLDLRIAAGPDAG